jgi:hypothetical protein
MARMSMLTLITAPAMLVMTTFVSNASVHKVGSCGIVRNQGLVCGSPTSASDACCNKTKTAKYLKCPKHTCRCGSGGWCSQSCC